MFDADEIEPIVTAEVGGSALFASRFRECAARALLLPRRHPGKRSPLWHQRQRAAQLLDVARKYPDFPIVLETVRECLQDVYDVPTLTELMRRLAQRRLRIVEVETATPSPFAASLLFGYVGAFMYEGDSPLAERRAAALSLDSTLLAELLGRVELRELLDPQVIATTAAQLQHLSAGPRGPRRRGRGRPAAAAGAVDRGRDRRAVHRRRCRRLAGGTARRQAGAHGVVRRADVVGGDRGHRPVARRGRRGRAGRGARDLHRSASPIRSANCSADTPAPTARSPRPTPRPGSGWASASPPTCWAGWRSTGKLMRGEFTDPAEGRRPVVRRRRAEDPAAPLAGGAAGAGGAGQHRRLCAVPARVAAGRGRNAASGIDGLAAVIDQLAGVPIPASAVEPLVFSARVRDYQPAMLDELLASGEVTWSGAGTIGGGDGWIAFHPADSAPLTLAPPTEIEFTDTHRAIMEVLGGGGAYFFRQLARRSGRRAAQSRPCGN